MPRDELEHLAEEFGLEPGAVRPRDALAMALHERQQLIAATDRQALLDVIQWGRRPVPSNATREQLAREIVRIKSMRFNGLSHRGLLALAIVRGVEILPDDQPRDLVKRLKRQEGLLAKLNRKRRAWLGSMVSGMLGEAEAGGDYQFLPPQQDAAGEGPAADTPPASIKQEIEEAGLFGGITSRIKRSADAYLNQKLDEIETRIDRKLDEIDRRLGEWRDKEVANRLRILKITLWASVIVALLSLIYSYIKYYVTGG